MRPRKSTKVNVLSGGELLAGEATWRNAETYAGENVGRNETHGLDIELKK